jgi:uncharacterized protein (TIGR03435 family)
MKEEPICAMNDQVTRRLDLSRGLSLAVAGFFGIVGQVAFGQMHTLPGRASPTTAQAPVTTGKRLEFEVASVRKNKSEDEASMNISPLLGDGPVPPGNLYLAKNIKLIQFIAFAYGLTQIQLRSLELHVPWTTQDRFDIEARAQGNPTKADYRLMMQSLLADRFKLKVHYETRVVPLYVLVLAKPGKFGPQLRLHRADDPVCAKPATSQNPNEVDAEGYPEVCGGPYGMMPSKPGRMKSGGRDVSIARFTAILTGVGVVDRPMLDKTGIQGTVDYSMEWRKVVDQVARGAPFELDEDAPTFADALKEQLGIKMLPQKGPSELFLVDHIERPSEN